MTSSNFVLWTQKNSFVSLRNLYLIGNCLSLDEHPTFRETIITQFSDPNFDWDDFIWTCSNHLIIPVIYLKFREYDLLEYLPNGLASHLEEIYTLNCVRNEQILLQMREINATLNKAGISPIYLKGTGNLIDRIYCDIGERTIGDIDLLVPEADYLKAIDLAKETGYVNYWGEPRNPEQLKHYPRLYKNEVPADLEIHRLPVRPEYAKYLNAEMIIQNKKVVAAFPGCYVPCHDHKVILNFIHSQFSNSGHRLGVVSLRDIYDIYLFSKITDLTIPVDQICCSKKMMAYFAIAHKLLGIPVSKKQSRTSTFFIWKHDMNYSSPIFHSINRIPWVISRMVFHGYPKLIKEVIIDKDARRSLFRRLGNRKWYMTHLMIYKKMIRG